MVKDRKLLLGTSNLGKTNLSSANFQKSPVEDTANRSIDKSFTRSWSHQLIAPDEYDIPLKKSERQRKISTLSTWRKGAVYERDFKSTTASSFVDPKSIPSPKNHYREREPEEIEAEKKLNAERKRALEAMCQMTKARYGTTASMLKSFKKRVEDNISLFEFGEQLRRQGIPEEELTMSEAKLVFDYVNPKHGGEVHVNEFLKKAEEQEFHDTEHKQNMLQLRDFLKKHVEEVRERKKIEAKEAKKRSRHPLIDARKEKKGHPLEEELMKKAVGHQDFDLDVGVAELNEAIEEAAKMSMNSVEHHKFARFLRHGNLKLHTIPFYDMRWEQLDRLKHRAAALDHEIEDEKNIGRLNELERTRWDSSKSTINFNIEQHERTMRMSGSLGSSLGGSTGNGAGRDAGGSSRSGMMDLSKSMPSLHISARPSPLAGAAESVFEKNRKLAAAAAATESVTGGGTPSATAAAAAASSGAPAAVERKVKPKAKNFAEDTHNRGVDYDSQSFGGGSASFRSASSGDFSQLSNATSPSKQRLRPIHNKEKLLFDRNEAQAADFYVAVVDGSQAMGRMKDTSKVVRIEKVDQNVAANGGKKVLSQGVTDWSRIGVGGERAEGDVGYGKVDVEDRFLTTTAKFYPELIYEPSKPVRRHLISEAESDFSKRERRRQQRKARVDANLEVTRTRLEYDELAKKMNEYRRWRQRSEDTLKYTTSIFMNDLRSFKKQPLERMSKKPNMKLYEKMWGGNQQHDTHVNRPEDREFGTVYTTSFDSSKLILQPKETQPLSETG